MIQTQDYDISQIRYSSFHYGTIFLNFQRQRDIKILYSFFNKLDDYVDTAKDTEIVTQKILWWFQEINNIYEGNKLQNPLSKLLSEIIDKYKIPQIYFQEFIQGMLMDLKFQGYDTFEDLKLYCHCVASTVGLILVHVLGFKHKSTLDYARKIGIALQLINIIRDIGEDARNNRIYIPNEDLNNHNISANDLLSLRQPPELSTVLDKYANLARSYHTQALGSLNKKDFKSQAPGIVMANIYMCLLDEIAQDKYMVMDKKTILTPRVKLWQAITTYYKICILNKI